MFDPRRYCCKTSKNGMATPTFSNGEFAALLQEPMTMPTGITATTTTPTKSNETAAGGVRTAEGVQHHQRQAEKTEEQSDHRASKGDPRTAAGVEAGHQEAMRAAAMVHIHNNARQQIWEAAKGEEGPLQQPAMWEGACNTALQQVEEEYSPLLSMSFEQYYLFSGKVTQILVVNEARRRAHDIYKFRCKKCKQRTARAARKCSQNS